MMMQCRVPQSSAGMQQGLTAETALALASLLDDSIASSLVISCSCLGRFRAKHLCQGLACSTQAKSFTAVHRCRACCVQGCEAVLCWTLQSLLRHICMARRDDHAKSLSSCGQRLQIATMHCLKLIVAALQTGAWSAAWAEVRIITLTENVGQTLWLCPCFLIRYKIWLEREVISACLSSVLIAGIPHIWLEVLSGRPCHTSALSHVSVPGIGMSSQ